MARKKSKPKPERATPAPTQSERRKSAAAPAGFTLRCTLRGHTDVIGRIAWSPDGRLLATPFGDKTVRVRDAGTGHLVRTLEGHTNDVVTVSWSPDGRLLASGGQEGTVRVWDAGTGQPVRHLEGHTLWVKSLSWSPDGRLLTSGGDDGTVRVWDAGTGQPVRKLGGNTGLANSVSWSPDGRLLASGGQEGTVQVWDAGTGQPVRHLEGHTEWVKSLSWSSDGRLLASKSGDGTVRLWRGDTWAEVGRLSEPCSSTLWAPSLAFHPSRAVLATLGEKDRVVRIWDLDIDAILGQAPAAPPTVYTTAKVVLLGDSNIGKSWLASQLIERRTPAPDQRGTTHGMRIWKQPAEVFDPAAAPPAGENREVFLWDFGGQDEYQLVHQMFLHDTTFALVLIDPHP
jgi:WD40 repeat protein